MPSKKTKTPSIILSPEQLSDRWGNAVGVPTLANWRVKGKGPRFVKVGGRVRYPIVDVEQWEEKRRAASTAEYDRSDFD